MEGSMKQPKKFPWALTTLVSILVVGGAFLITGCSRNDSPTATPGAPSAAAPDPNGEGVRPDVRTYIETTYPNSAKTRAALFQDAKVIEKALADAANKQLSIQHADESNRASTCLWYTFGTVEASVKARREMQSVILNTDARNKAYFIYNEQLGGEVFGDIPYDQHVSACDINPSTLPN
jgi:hypothetical protein